MQAADLESLQIPQQLLILIQVKFHLAGNLVLRRGTAQALRHRSDRLFDRTTLATQLARTPVQRAQRVQDRPANAELGVALELHLLAVVELGERIDQPY